MEKEGREFTISIPAWQLSQGRVKEESYYREDYCEYVNQNMYCNFCSLYTVRQKGESIRCSKCLLIYNDYPNAKLVQDNCEECGHHVNHETLECPEWSGTVMWKTHHKKFDPRWRCSKHGCRTVNIKTLEHAKCEWCGETDSTRLREIEKVKDKMNKILCIGCKTRCRPPKTLGFGSDYCDWCDKDY